MKIIPSNKISGRREFVKMAAIGGTLLCSPIAIFGSNKAIKLSPDQVAFLRACHAGILAEVQEILSTAASESTLADYLNARDKQGRSGFALALLAGHIEVSKVIKNAGYQPDLHETVLDLDWEHFGELIGEESMQTADQVNANHPIGGSLMWAAAAGGAGTNIWRVYANCGDPNLVTDPKSSSPLQKALRFHDLATAEITAAALLSNATDPNPAPNADMSPLHIASARGSFDLVEMLIRQGAIVNAISQYDQTPLMMAKEAGHQNVVEILSNHDQIPRTCFTSRSAFDVYGKPYVLPDLADIPLYKRGNIVGKAHSDMDGLKTAFAANPMLAHSIATTGEKGVEAGAHMGRKDIVDLFLSNGAPYSLPTAVLLNDFNSVKRMLDEDPNRIQERGAHDFALLWYPIIGGGNIDMMKLLLDRGADIEQQHFLGTTALHWACFRGPIEIIELLIDHGADVNRIGRKFDPAGSSPLQSSRDEKIINYLKSKGAH